MSTKTSPGTPAMVTCPGTELMVHGAVRRPQAHALCEPRCWLTSWLTDGITLGHPYFVETRALMGDVILSGKLTRILDRYLNE